MGLSQNLFLGVFTWWHSRPSILLLVNIVIFIILLSLKPVFIHVTYNKLLLFKIDASCGGYEMLPISLGPSNTGSLVGNRLRRIKMRRCVAFLEEACHWWWRGAEVSGDSCDPQSALCLLLAVWDVCVLFPPTRPSLCGHQLWPSRTINPSQCLQVALAIGLYHTI